jgi:hypothetical protein
MVAEQRGHEVQEKNDNIIEVKPKKEKRRSHEEVRSDYQHVVRVNQVSPRKHGGQ